ncbi:8-oxoguanine deaminase [Oricola cellulosilytica]|uniref:8-oxoguanine deaminase n=1 Tax=Oricola cellulosilytica TaxID=1429082 RepID=A0A4R0P653_9HYPH|nr:8-oxoguanine deaminase [Oricola cellulosilytica]TCD11353.1 8-oxoguanine deaminase [Oricola cellulosilytica]
MSSKRLWLKRPLAVLAQEGQDASGGIVVEDGRITELVGHGGVPSGDHVTFDASEHVVLPGLINTHHHFFQTVTRAHPEALDKELFDWLKALYPVWAKLGPDAFRLATRLALAELMMSGVTCTSDHQYLFTDGIEDAMDVQAEESAALGMRMVLNRGSMNLSQRDGGLPPDAVVQDMDTILADCERVIGRYHDPSDGAMLQVALAPCSPFSVTSELMRETAALAGRCGCALHTHLAESEDENAFCQEKFGFRPLDYLEENGWLGPKTWVAHGIHFNDGEIARMGRAGTSVCHCPTSNMVLASGICRTRDMETAGVSVGLGVDGSASNDSSNLMETVRHALMVNRLRYGTTVSHKNVLRWATEGSAACLGRTDIGAIAPGRQADLALFKLDELRFSGAHDPIAALVLCGAHRADRVMIKGRWTIENGLPTDVDVERLRHEHGAIARKFAGAQ